jgi:ribosomal subunit interface protein
MSQGALVVVHFKEVPGSKKVRSVIEDRCDQLALEFREVTQFEITFTPLGSEVSAHAHATGKNTHVATHASGANLRAAADQALEKVERQLRKNHDKRIFSQRREAQRQRARRTAGD